MKTTIEISENILQRAKQLAQREETTLKSLVEEGLDYVLKAHSTQGKHTVKPVVFAGNGLSPNYKHASWAKIRDTVYDRRET